MIKLKNVSKKFQDVPALHDITASISEGEVFGLVGTNGAGKSTLLRLAAGVLKQDSGEILIDGMPVWDNPESKAKICFIPDVGYFPVNATPLYMMKTWEIVYPEFREKRFLDFLKKAGLEERRRVHTFSKGMKKQLSLFLGICSNTKYLLCDETFDGLDPVIRQAVKGLLAAEILDRDFVPVIASHNLRELEDICDHVGLLHKGGILFSKDMEEMKETIHKVQCVVSEESKYRLLKNLDVMKTESRGNLLMLTVRGSKADIEEKFQKENPVYFEVLPLSLEEIFISETEVVGYDVKNLLF